jgi:hypothetical protein
VAYWGEVNDLLQRREHGAQKERELLEVDDGRRAVFHAAVVMYEFDGVLGRATLAATVAPVNTPRAGSRAAELSFV